MSKNQVKNVTLLYLLSVAFDNGYLNRINVILGI